MFHPISPPIIFLLNLTPKKMAPLKKILSNPQQKKSSWPPLVGCIIYYLKKCWRLHTLTVIAQLTPNKKSYQLYKAEIEFNVMEEMYAASCMRMCAEKTTF